MQSFAVDPESTGPNCATFLDGLLSQCHNGPNSHSNLISSQWTTNDSSGTTCLWSSLYLDFLVHYFGYGPGPNLLAIPKLPITSVMAKRWTDWAQLLDRLPALERSIMPSWFGV